MELVENQGNNNFIYQNILNELGMNLEKFVEDVVGGSKEDRIVIQQMRALKENGVVLNAGTMF